MENKKTTELSNLKTTELLDLLTKLTDKDGNLQEGYEEAREELENRDPFFELLNEGYDEGLPSLKEQVEELVSEIKKLKRHKHDEKSGDVLIRI